MDEQLYTIIWTRVNLYLPKNFIQISLPLSTHYWHTAKAIIFLWELSPHISHKLLRGFSCISVNSKLLPQISISFILHRFNTERIATQINMFALPIFMSCAVHFKKIASEVPQGLVMVRPNKRHKHEIQLRYEIGKKMWLNKIFSDRSVALCHWFRCFHQVLLVRSMSSSSDEFDYLWEITVLARLARLKYFLSLSIHLSYWSLHLATWLQLFKRPIELSTRHSSWFP